ncbi:HNH endonuclease [Gaetbulibacter sp. NE]|uniref:HNH endonuclease n=1 Tax=Gaetbulibacter sp. NE TaxID=2982307 RepID=UPI0021CEAF3D|nr:HNH endonuclease [Gaetbulibacter sp. NE]
MNKQEIKRTGIFNKYIKNLNFLNEYGFVQSKKNVYICPICLSNHTEINTENPLTLEDAPPKSLGGKANTLTCKKCNNECGYKIDSHLVKRMRDLDKPKLLPNSSIPIEIKIDNEIIRAEITIDTEGNQKLISSLKNNNPNILRDRIKKGKKIEQITILREQIKPDNLEYALLKTAYLMVFEKFGYLFILDKSYDIVREQLTKPNQRIYPNGFWITQNLPESYCGCFILKNKDIKSLTSNFILDTGKSKTMFIVQLPLPNLPINISISKKLEQERKMNLKFYPNPNIERDYLFNLDNIKELKVNIE